MEDTCNKDCEFGKLFKSERECCNYIESWWKPLEGQPVLIKDCAPRRNFWMIQDLYNRLIGVQQANEEQRNESNKIVSAFAKIVNIAQKRTELKEIV